MTLGVFVYNKMATLCLSGLKPLEKLAFPFTRNYISILHLKQNACSARVLKMQYTSDERNKTSLNVIQPVVQSEQTTGKSDKARKISSAIRAYLQQAQTYNEFIKKETAEYEIGKRHLANIMGKDPDEFTQQDIDKAIEYLLPSGLFVLKARPMLKPPLEIFPKKKEAQFNEEGRPFHSFFYTAKPNYYHALHEIAINMEKLNNYEDKMIQKGILNPESEEQMALKGSEWISKDAFEKKMIETVSNDKYNYFITCINRLVAHPYSKQVQEFITGFRHNLVQETQIMDIPPLKYDDKGRPYMDAKAQRKTAIAEVIVRGNGTGKITINEDDINYFKTTQYKEQLMFPLQFANMIDELDVEAVVHGSGPAAKAGAVRFGISKALRSFLTKQEVERMRLAGLLTLDPRTKERKKFGQKGARAKFTWKKR